MTIGMGMRSMSRDTHPDSYGQMLFDMTMQTAPVTAFGKPFAIFYFSVSSNWFPLDPISHPFIGIPIIQAGRIHRQHVKC